MLYLCYGLMAAMFIVSTFSFLIANRSEAATPVLVQHVNDVRNDTSDTLNPSWSAPTTAGNLLVAVMSVRTPGAGALPSGFTPPAGVGWTLAVDQTVDLGTGGGRGKLAMYYIANADSQSGATGTWTYSNGVYMGGSTSATITLLEYSGIDTSSPLDVTASAASLTNNGAYPYTDATTVNSGTPSTTSQAHELAVAALMTSYTQSAPSNSFVAQDTITSPIFLTVADKILTATGTPNTSATYASPFANIGVIATFKYTVADPTAPDAPTGLTATKQTNAKTIDLSWSAPGDNGGSAITGYKIERESPVDGGFSTLVAHTGTTGTTYANTGLDANTQYNYRVSAINAIGTSDPSSEADATTNNVPGIPTSLTATASGYTIINLSWSAPASTGGSAITGYKIERESPVGGGFSTIVADTASTGTTYSNTGLSGGTQYNYRVSTINAIGTGSVSATAAATLGTPTCGDGVVSAGEDCDGAGESISCNSDCTSATCGDGKTNATAGEECDDDENNGSTKQCTLSCRKTYCGDGVVQTPNGNGQSEECEMQTNGTCTASCTVGAGVGGSTVITASSSSRRSSSSRSTTRLAPPPSCGNGVVDTAAKEQCDDGIYNGLSPNCDRWCQKQFCGNGVIERSNNEECEPERSPDGTTLVPMCGTSCTVPVCEQDGTCTGGCKLTFLPACTIADSGSVLIPVSQSSSVQSSFGEMSSAFSEAILPIDTAQPISSESSSSSSSSEVLDDFVAVDPMLCGDGIVQLGEECDGGEENNMLGLGCTPDCRISVCGNSMLEPGEECDDGPRNTDNKADACSTLCLLPRCGDNITDMNFGEICDNGLENADALPDACRSYCVPARCGDRVIDSNEECDDGFAGSEQCTSQCTLKPANSVATIDEVHSAAPQAPADGVSLPGALLSVGAFAVVAAGALKFRRLLRTKKPR